MFVFLVLWISSVPLAAVVLDVLDVHDVEEELVIACARRRQLFCILTFLLEVLLLVLLLRLLVVEELSHLSSDFLLYK